MVDVDARQLGRQPQATRCLWFLRRGRRHISQGLQFFLDGRQVLVHRLLQQTELGGVQLFAALAIAPALVHGQFMRELVDVRLLGVDDPIPCGNLPITRRHFAHESLDRCTELLLIEVIEGGYRVLTIMVGSVASTLTLTDIASGWMECVALLVREASLVTEAIDAIRYRAPFVLKGVDSDNGSYCTTPPGITTAYGQKRTFEVRCGRTPGVKAAPPEIQPKRALAAFRPK